MAIIQGLADKEIIQSLAEVLIPDKDSTHVPRHAEQIEGDGF